MGISLFEYVTWKIFAQCFVGMAWGIAGSAGLPGSKETTDSSQPGCVNFCTQTGASTSHESQVLF
jgi:hypothetical protein